VQEQTGCVEGGNHCGRKGEPESTCRELEDTRTRHGGVRQNADELTDGTEYNAGESVAEYELKDTRDKQQKATKEDDRPAILVTQIRNLALWQLGYPLRECNPIPTSSSPGHQAT